MAAPVESLDEPAQTGELVWRLREAAGLSVGQGGRAGGHRPERLQALETGEGVSELGYAEVCALVRATQPPRPAWWTVAFEHDLTVTRYAPPATAEGRRYWSGVAEVRRQMEDRGRGRPA